MSILSTECVMESGADIFHYSHSPNQLLRSGAFDPTRSNHDGAFFFTPVAALRSNCVATLKDNLLLFDYTDLPQDEVHLLEEAGEGNFWEGAAKLGFDGRLFLTADPFAEVSKHKYCPELLIFRNSLVKITEIRKFSARDKSSKYIH